MRRSGKRARQAQRGLGVHPHRLPFRVPVSALFGNLAAGATPVKDFLEWFPGVEEWQVKAVLEHEVKSLDAKVSIESPV